MFEITLCDAIPNNFYEIARDCPPSGWEDVFERTLPSIKHAQLMTDNFAAESGRRTLPRYQQVFNCFERLPPHRVRVVIVGQDPYPTPGIANGMSFSTMPGVKPPPSLRNIFSELARCYSSYRMPEDGDLTKWADQGVLLLNTSLTVPSGMPDGYKALWKSFILEIFNYIALYNPECIVVLWGRAAETAVASTIPRSMKKLISGHPSPINTSSTNPFKGCGHFPMINRLLRETFGETEMGAAIDWQT